MAASVISFAENPRISTWSGNFGFAFANWNSDWLIHRPIEALMAIQVGASRRTCDERMSAPYRRNPTCSPSTASRSPAGSFTPSQ